MMIRQKKYEIRCFLEILETISKYFPDADISIETKDGCQIVCFSSDINKSVSIYLCDFKDSMAKLRIETITMSPGCIDSSVTESHVEDIDTFFIHFKTTMALKKLGIIKTDDYDKLIGHAI